MEPTFALFLLLAIGAFLALGIAAAMGLPTLMRHFEGASGGWGRLVAAYATTKPLPSSVLDRQTLMVGKVLYRNCLIVAAIDDGLYLKLGFPLSFLHRPPLLVPWNEFKGLEEGMIYWRKAALLHIGDPMIGTITVPMELFAKIQSHMNIGSN